MRELKDVEAEDLRRIINRIKDPNSSFDNFEKNFNEYFLAESNSDAAYRVADFIFDHGIAMSEKDLIKCNNTQLVDVVHYIKTKLV
ncbi:hypothetical protein PP175_10735 [Aneurinibacillus sp. Ricciae_BoGa-3]|uniref:hypothetical protein n=1 Tax=Aneurinibacillus sp. Ricciae_BoGa-3 TaxID=3022697 RepID=UPI00234023F6|nr:hypothetical protein [Aneurinibacillus sp. Ricciae_BoGa-3]WCK56343.1 hypothetical protein PP175_10735 [Aneurinibacillus sp. Ricciae_BoGa-3]